MRSARPSRLGLISAGAIVAAGALVSVVATADAARAVVARTGNRASHTLAPAARYVVATTGGNEVRYRIREQLARMPLPNDAVGKTTEIGGGISFAPDGSVIASESKFMVNVGSLTSDRDMRDNYVRGRVLEAGQYPSVEFAATSIRGLPTPLPTSGTHTFQVLGNLTVHGVTKPTIWDVSATMQNGQVTGNAATAFTFDDFELHQPRVPIVLSVGDTIRLEYDFTLVPKND